MIEEKKSNDIDLMHILYLGGLLTEALKIFHNDFINNGSFAAELMTRPTYMRVWELCNKFDQEMIATKSAIFLF
jgi:hypothetical protein